MERQGRARRETSVNAAHLLGVALIVLAVGMVDQPPRSTPVVGFIDAPLSATTSGRNPIRNAAACEAIVGLPRGSVQAVYNVSAYAPGAWPYWRTICVYKLPPGPTTYRVIS